MAKKDKLTRVPIIRTEEDFNNALKDNIGLAFVYGDIEAVDPVSIESIKGEGAFVKERTMVCRTTGRSSYWAITDENERTCQTVRIFGHEFSSDRIDWTDAAKIGEPEIDAGTKVEYYKANTKQTGTLYTSFENGTISENSKFYNEATPESLLGGLSSELLSQKLIFFGIWAFTTLVCVFVVPCLFF